VTDGYLDWLASLETFTGGVANRHSLLDLEVLPAATRIGALTDAVGRLSARLTPAGTPARHIAVVVAAACGSAARVYAGDIDAAHELITEVTDLVTKATEAGKTVLVQTLPYGPDFGAPAVELGNRLLADVVAPPTELVPVHRFAPLDALIAAEDFTTVSAALNAMGRRDRAVYLWNLIVDLAWAHWNVLARTIIDAPKAILADLDGVLWPGTIAEDGISGALGAGGPLGQLAHEAWRTYLRTLQDRGVLVAAITKNDARAAQAALDQLQPPLQIAGMWASPDIDKSVAAVAALEFFDGIAEGHAAAVDDTPMQQEFLRGSHPHMWVPAVVAPPLLIQDLLRQMPPAPTGPVTSSDRQRTQFYAARDRGELIPEIICMEDPSDPSVLQRMAQLHARTNQFNMTSPRRDVATLTALVNDPDWTVLAFQAVYHGSNLGSEIVGCAEIHHLDCDHAELNSFLSSCRLAWAGAQRRMFEQIKATTRQRGVQTLTAWWQPNGRNDAYALWFAHQGWASPQPLDEGWRFSGSTATKDGETADDLLAIMSRYLAKKPSHSTEATRTRRRVTDGSTEVLVPGGQATIGLNQQDIAVVRAVFGLNPIGEEQRRQLLKPFWIDQRLISREQFATFLASLNPTDLAGALEVIEGDYQLEPMDNVRPTYDTGALPAVVPWQWAARYATWVGGRLPTEVEWEYAVSGKDQRWFPWGAEPPGPPHCLARGSSLHSIDHNTGGTSPSGVDDLVGHVWQWCSDTYRGHPQYRGGDTHANAYFLRATVRPLEAAEHCGHTVGFRVVRDIDPSESER
jgi:FkbH-like protein